MRMLAMIQYKNGVDAFFRGGKYRPTEHDPDHAEKQYLKDTLLHAAIQEENDKVTLRD